MTVQYLVLDYYFDCYASNASHWLGGKVVVLFTSARVVKILSMRQFRFKDARD